MRWKRGLTSILLNRETTGSKYWCAGFGEAKSRVRYKREPLTKSGIGVSVKEQVSAESVYNEEAITPREHWVVAICE